MHLQVHSLTFSTRGSSQVFFAPVNFPAIVSLVLKTEIPLWFCCFCCCDCHYYQYICFVLVLVLARVLVVVVFFGVIFLCLFTCLFGGLVGCLLLLSTMLCFLHFAKGGIWWFCTFPTRLGRLGKSFVRKLAKILCLVRQPNLKGHKQWEFMYIFWSNYSDLTRPHHKWWFRKGNHLISWKPRLVKYYSLARYYRSSCLNESCLLGRVIPWLDLNYRWWK